MHRAVVEHKWRDYILAWTKERIFRLHDWRNIDTFPAEGGRKFTRQECRNCGKTRVNWFPWEGS